MAAKLLEKRFGIKDVSCDEILVVLGTYIHLSGEAVAEN